MSRTKIYELRKEYLSMIAVLFILFGIAVAQEPQVNRERIETITLRGVFVDAEKQPVAGATVYAFLRHAPLFDQSTTTNERGEFSFEISADDLGPNVALVAHLPERQLWGEIRGTHESWAESWGQNTIALFKEGETDIAPITIESTPEPTDHLVTVVDTEGKPVEGAFVLHAGGIVGKTDAKGQFVLIRNPLNRTVRQLAAFKPGVGLDFIDQSWEGTTMHVDRRKLPFTAGPFRFTLDGKTVKVRVVDETGLPVEGAVVQPRMINRADNFHSHHWFGDHHFAIRVGEYRADAELRPWQARTSTEGIATFDWFPLSDIASVSLWAAGGWNANYPIERNLIASGTWEKKAELLVNAVFDRHQTRYDRDAENNVCEERDWQKIFDDIPEIRVTFRPPPTRHPEVPFNVDYDNYINYRATAKVTVRQPDGTPVAWYPFQQRTANVNGEVFFIGSPGLRQTLTGVGKTGIAPSIEFQLGTRGTEKQIDIVLQKGTKLHGNVTRADGSTLELLSFLVREIREDSENRAERRLRTARDPEPPLPYQILLPPGKFEVVVGSVSILRAGETTSGSEEWHRYMFTKTLIIDGTQDEIELDIVLERGGRE